MKLKLKISFSLIVIVLFAIVSYLSPKTHNKITNLTIINIESLAVGEGSNGIRCYTVGSVDCPDGAKAVIACKSFNCKNDTYEYVFL